MAATSLLARDAAVDRDDEIGRELLHALVRRRREPVALVEATGE